MPDPVWGNGHLGDIVGKTWLCRLSHTYRWWLVVGWLAFSSLRITTPRTFYFSTQSLKLSYHRCSPCAIKETSQNLPEETETKVDDLKDRFGSPFSEDVYFLV